MSVKQFEEFIASYFLNWAEKSIQPGFRYQFQSPNLDSSAKLYKSFVALKFVPDSIDAKDVSLAYITCGDTKLIPVLHNDSHNEDGGYTENFISFLRDEVAGQQGAFKSSALLIIHNSLLDTIVNSAEDLTNYMSVFDPNEIKTALLDLVDSDAPAFQISRILLDYQFDLITEDQGSMFGFETLYKVIADGIVEFHELGLLPDPPIQTMTGSRASEQIRKRLDRNRELHDQIVDVLEHYPDQLIGNLPDLSASFIDRHFSPEAPDAWKDITYDEFRKEQDRNRDQNLEVKGESSATGELIVRTRDSSKSAQKARHLLLVVDKDRQDFDISLEFIGGKVKQNELKVVDKCPVSPITLEGIQLTGGSVNTSLVITGSMRIEPRYFRVELDREKTSEKYKFHCLVVQKGLFNTEAIKNHFLIHVNKNFVNLQTQETTLEISATGGNKSSVMSDVGQSFSVVDQDIVDFTELSNEVDRINFDVVSGEAKITFDVEGAAATDVLVLPLLLDLTKKAHLFSDELYGVYNRTKERVYINNQEVKGSSRGTQLLNYEAMFVSEELVFCGEGDVDSVSYKDFKFDAPALSAAYSDLYKYYRDNNTLPSLCGWGPKYQRLVGAVVKEYRLYLDAIPQKQYLDDNHRCIVQVGMANLDNKEYILPIHPLVLSYYLYLAQCAVKDPSESFLKLPGVTLERLNPQGLLPFIFDADNDFSYVKAEEDNCFWLHCVPNKEANYSYVTKLVKDKISEFSTAFSSLFEKHRNSESRTTLIVNSVNNYDNHELFMGAVAHVVKYRTKTFNIHINLYDDQLMETELDRFSEMASYDRIKQHYRLNKGAAKDHADTIVDMLRTRVTYSKFTHSKVEEQAYAHLTFFRNNQKVKVINVNPVEKLSGVCCHGLINGEASANEHGNYITGFGLNGVEYKDLPHVEIAKLVGRLIRPARESTVEYRDNSAIALAVDDRFKELLERSYDSSIWTSIIDPKVTLDFFDNSENMLLIHYSDQYTSSASYDAITVTRQTDLYHRVLAAEDGGLIGEFNAFNGEWLLQMVTASANIRKERKGILAAYKLVSCLLAESDITWVPMSAAEMIRVSGNIGLNMSESELSRHVQGYSSGAISDDVLFVGVKDENLYLLPLEVKTGVGYNAAKAVKQAQELSRYLVNDVLGGDALERKIYRSLFIRQLLMQVDKYLLYSVYPKDYFKPLLDTKEWWLQGDYEVSAIADYPRGFVVANLEGDACLETSAVEVDGILKIEVPYSFIPASISTSLQDLMANKISTAVAPLPDKYFLTNAEPEPFEQVEPADVTELIDDVEPEATVKPVVEVPPVVEIEQVETAHNLDNESLKILVGNDVKHDQPVFWEYNHRDLPNRHLIIFGRSGQGKTYCIQGLLMDMAKNNVNSMVVDYTNGFLPEQLEPEFNAKVNPKTDLVAHRPLGLNPFERQTQSFAGIQLTDKSHNVAGRIASVFNSVYSTIGEQQLPTMIRVIEEGLDLYGDGYSFEKMLSDLAEDGKVGEALANKLSPMVKANIFSTEKSNGGWDQIYTSHDSKTRLIQLASLPRDVWRLASEFILWDLYAYACNKGTKHNPLPVVLDEVQNLDHRLDSPLGKMLTEGRKYGLSLILATQTLSNLKKDEQDRLFQAAHKLFFAPAETEIKKYAEILEITVKNSTRQQWVDVLSSLKKGQCLSVGYHLNESGTLELGVKKVQVSSLADRIISKN